MTNPVTICRALGDPIRWRIARLVKDEALCVCELADILEMPQSSVSSHVQIIRKAGLLESEKAGKWTYFRIGKPVLQLIRMLEEKFSSDADPAWEMDDRRAIVRMAERENSCCPGPVTFTSRRRKPSPTHP